VEVVKAGRVEPHGFDVNLTGGSSRQDVLIRKDVVSHQWSHIGQPEEW
jgi:hypothetical protein